MIRTASAGTMESNDCLIIVTEQPINEGIVIELESIVKNQFGQQIEKVILDTLNELKIANLHIFCNDKGALDYTIRARLITALERLKHEDA